MARGILMPNLMGATPEEKTGSFARAAVVFDVFMFAVDALRAQVEECINDQIIWRMMAVNYPTDADEYPRFKFKALTQDSRITLMDTWCKLVDARGVINRVDDEDHIREIMGFPAADSEPIPPPVPPAGLDPFGVPPDKGVVPGKGKKQELAQKEVNFKAIEKRLDWLEQVFIKDAKVELGKVLSNLQERVSQGLPHETLSIADLWAGGGMMGYQAPLEQMMLLAFEEGTHQLSPDTQVTMFRSDVRTWLRDAVSFLKRKAITLTTSVTSEILRDIRQVLITVVDTGMSISDTSIALEKRFEKWTGSDEKPPTRLQLIARNEATASYNHGVVVASRDPYVKPLLEGLRHESILDNRTTDVCRFLGRYATGNRGGVIHRIDSDTLDELSPPLHPHCRSILVPVETGGEIDQSLFITRSQVERAKELAGSGFAGGGSF